MKKIFTCISLAAATFMATTPVMAQQQKLTDKEKAAVIEAIVPAMFEQVKQVSGIDIIELAKPNIENVLSSPVFGTASTLRAETLIANPITVQPDSMKVNLSEISKDIPAMFSQITLKMSNYYTANLSSTNGLPIELNLPKTISTTILGSTVSLNFELGKQTGLLPFDSFTAKLDLGGLSELAGVMGIKGGELFSLKEKATNAGMFDYNVTIGESLRSVIALLEKDEEEKTTIPNFLIKTNMTQQAKGLVEASLYAVPTTSSTVQVPMGDAQVYLNLKAAATGKMSPDSILLTSYKNGQKEGYRKLATKMEQKGQNFVITSQDSTKTLNATEWKWSATETITMTNRTNATEAKAIVAETITRAIAELAATGTTNPYSMVVTKTSDMNGDGQVAAAETITLLKADVTTAMGGSVTAPAMNVAVKIQTPNDTDGQLTEGMDIAINLPLKGDKVVADFTPVGYDKPVATMYVKSDAMGIITDNETIENDVEEVKVSTTASGLYVKNGKGNYVIVNMVGRVVSTGIITSDGQYISTPNMPNGIYMISIDQSKLLRSAHKTTVKFVK
ncbi:DUF6383 domain-containing protein [Parabacteroides distasonis]|uniref:DUF6383 domain-containing protein n=1 Tax=Parabacteroides distasonis TaxID=823 RepID=A0AAW6F163_PARDI|nr:DUF6383 domain-containing protein [Parabacteroides distasonis]MDB9137009.1 DUF6383 domain-containing protein [Parabacteroides distasonis]MDB9141442.1 DUF6383 domain-containing protein [Parabacteroides distasonis]